jgi:hypothetical protein
MDKLIIPECYADTLLIETLVPTNKGYNHQHNCFKVEATMKGLDSFALGIIDKDKKQVKYLDSFKVIDKVEGDLILWRHADENIHHWIVQICPALERLLLKICEAEHIDTTGFGENALDGIKYYTKSISRLDNPKLQALFSEINSKNENVVVRKLKGWIKLLKEKNYKVVINELVNV